MPERATREKTATAATRRVTVQSQPRVADPYANHVATDDSPQELLRLQRTVGNRAVQRAIELRTAPVSHGAVQRLFSKTVTIGEEKVVVKNKKEEAEAKEILKRIKENYGIEVSSKTTIQGIKDEYTDVKQKVKDKLKARAWKMRELRSLERALKFYAPILGGERANSTRAGSDQEVTSVGKVSQAIDEDSPAGKLDKTTLGEYFSSKKNMGLFKASENYKSDFKDLGDQLTGTFVHEIAHGLLSYTIPDYIKATGYWKERNTKLAKDKRTETPITSYGKTNAAEDLCESAMMFFIDPSRLESSCPLRYAFMQKVGKDWVPPPKEAPQLKPAPSEVPKVTDVKGETGEGSDVFDDLLKLLEDLGISGASESESGSSESEEVVV